MKGLVIWAQSACRSQMALYRALEKALGVPIAVALWYYKTDPDEVDNRDEVGFCPDEFSDMKFIHVGEDWEKGLAVLDSHPGWSHLFCNYQGSANYRRLQVEARRRGEKTAVGSESPCNMETGWRHWAKEAYYRLKLPRLLRPAIDAADFLINYSGADDRLARVIGWPKEKIVPFGYFPPPLLGSQCVRRTRANIHPFEILVTGAMTWHRGTDVILKALAILKTRGVAYHATITQKGPLFEKMRDLARRYDLPIDFPGLLPMSELPRAYERCSVYVGAGRREPWGMRLNDALNCGAPLVVSRGMGGVKMVDDYGCGLAFGNENSQDLADKLQLLANDEDCYVRCAENAWRAAQICAPEVKAVELADVIRRRWQ